MFLGLMTDFLETRFFHLSFLIWHRQTQRYDKWRYDSRSCLESGLVRLARRDTSAQSKR